MNATPGFEDYCPAATASRVSSMRYHAGLAPNEREDIQGASGCRTFDSP